MCFERPKEKGKRRLNRSSFSEITNNTSGKKPEKPDAYKTIKQKRRTCAAKLQSIKHRNFLRMYFMKFLFFSKVKQI